MAKLIVYYAHPGHPYSQSNYPMADVASALDGITRQVLFELAAAEGIPMVEKTLTRYDIYTADECFLTGTAAEVIPVVELDTRPVGDGTPGEVSRRLVGAFRELTRSTGTPIAGG